WVFKQIARRMEEKNIGRRSLGLAVLVMAILVVVILATGYLPRNHGSGSTGMVASIPAPTSAVTSAPTHTFTVTSMETRKPLSTRILSSVSEPTSTTTKMPDSTQTPTATPTPITILSNSRGYLTTPVELTIIKEKADQGIEPYESAVASVLERAKSDWDYSIKENVKCNSSETPAWNDNQEGTAVLYAKALAYHLTGENHYAAEVEGILQRIMTEVLTISLSHNQCRLNFAWGTPEMVAAADLIEDYWQDHTCTGPESMYYWDTAIMSGNCKVLFQNWLVKNPYYAVSFSASSSQSNWGAAATNTLAYIADYLWDRPSATLVHQNPLEVNRGQEFTLKPADAYTYANQLALDRMNGYGVAYGSSNSCDYLNGSQQSNEWEPVKSQITEKGIIPEDARRKEYCNVPAYDGIYHNYPQLHLGQNIQQCELMLRRGDQSCYDNVDNTDIPYYTFIGPDGLNKVTHLYPGRGSVERAIKAIIIDSSTEWRHDSALAVAFRYYHNNHTLPGIDLWSEQLDDPVKCSQDICFGLLTHGFAADEIPFLPPTVFPPQ
ncbi:MAG: hypothetical protein WA996_22765, partial [Candidatus Promineifilaceae bacterium]